MRPQSIVMFERLFLLSIALSAILAVLSYDDVLGVLANDQSMRQLGFGSTFLIAVLAASFAIYLLLWYLIARKAANAAKWILVVFVALGTLFSLPGLLQMKPELTTFLSLAGYALEIAAVVFLFRSDAVAWLKGEPETDAATFD